MVPTAMETLLDNIGLFFTEAIDWLSTVLSTIVDNPALLILCIAMPVCGFAVGLLARLIRL